MPRVSFDEMLTRADVITLHCPLTDETRGLVDASVIDRLPDDALVVNVGRGELVDQRALATALADGRLGGAGLDVLSSEPPPADNPLLDAPHCFITPHLAWATRAARQRLIDELAANLKAFLAGESRNRVD